jgi:hypothetical protein
VVIAAVYVVDGDRLLEGVNVAVLVPSYDTTPTIFPLPSLTVNVAVVMVESSIASVNVAVIALLIATSVVLLAGLVRLTAAATVKVPEFVVVKLPDVALISAVPEK